MRTGYPEGVERAKRALLEVAVVLEKYRENIMLIGGQTYGYMCDDTDFPYRGSLDIDVLIDNTDRTHEDISNVVGDLRALGYRPLENEGSYRIGKEYGGTTVLLDLLVSEETGEIDVGGIIRPQYLPEAYIARFNKLEVVIETSSNNDSIGIVIPDFDAAIALKALAYYGRKEDKDIIDIYFLLHHYPGGIPDRLYKLRPFMQTKLRDAFAYLKEAIDIGNAVDIIASYILSTSAYHSPDDEAVIRNGIKYRFDAFCSALFA